MTEFEDYDFYEEIEGSREEYKYFEKAKNDIVDLYEKDKEAVYYLRQLQVKFEKKYFHWITYHVIRYLHDSGKLDLKERNQQDGTTRHFYIHPSNRYPIRKINRMEKLINEFSQEHITRSCGQRAEDLFRMGFQKFGFKVIGEDIKEFKGKKWKKSGHDLDFIFERDGIYYGCEVKNALGYIEKKELETKIEMCSFLGIVPLFIMRFAPKSYIEQVRREGGFCLLYKYQLYELSQIYLVERIKKELDLPVGCPKAIEDGTIKRFENWHMRNLV